MIVWRILHIFGSDFECLFLPVLFLVADVISQVTTSFSKKLAQNIWTDIHILGGVPFLESLEIPH
jgi:hypothetical protein